MRLLGVIMGLALACAAQPIFAEVADAEATIASEPKQTNLSQQSGNAHTHPMDILSELTFIENQSTPFVQRQANPLMNRISEQHGTLLKDDSGLHMQVLTPRPELRTLKQGYVTLQRQRTTRRQHTSGNYTRQAQLKPHVSAHLSLLALEALLTRNLDFINEHFAVTSTNQGSSWQLTLIPKLPLEDSKATRLVVTGCANRLAQFRSESPSAKNSWMEVSLPETQCEPPVKAS